MKNKCVTQSVPDPLLRVEGLVPRLLVAMVNALVIVAAWPLQALFAERFDDRHSRSDPLKNGSEDKSHVCTKFQVKR